MVHGDAPSPLGWVGRSGRATGSVREVAQFAGFGTTSPILVGISEQVADDLERWLRDVGVDGFDVKEVTRLDSLRDFVDLVVPELRDRGLLREAYEAETLREQMLDYDPPLPADHPGQRGG